MRPKARASSSVPETVTSQPARPSLTQSRVLTEIEVWKGSVCVVVTAGTSPIRPVAGASRAKAARASGRCGAAVKESSRVTKSRVAPSAARASAV